MHFFDLAHTCALLLVGYLSVHVVASPHNSPQAQRILRAATKRSDLYRRSMRITKSFESEMAYVEKENGWNGDSTFATQVKVASQKPILNLEEHEHHLQDVQCGDGTMKLHFVDTSSARDARAACHGPNGGTVITSHDGCNDDGERAVYRVHEVSFADDGEALELSVTKTPWQDAFDYFDISFGHTTNDHLYRRHADFTKLYQKRQANKVDIAADTPDAVNTATFDLGSEVLNATFAADSFLAGIDQLIPIPALPIEMGCKNCTTMGQVALNQGAIKIDTTQIDLIPDIFEGGDDGKEITSVITGGYMELTATGLGAHLELFAKPARSGSFEIALFKLPILGFTIPGVGKAGAMFEPRIAADFEVSGGLEVNYGIDVAVPDDSSIRVQLTDVTNSDVNGFPGSTLTPLPFNLNVTDADVRLGLVFKPSIPIGFEFTEKLKTEVTISMNLPRLSALLSTNVAENCGNSTNATLPEVPYANQTQSSSNGLANLGSLVLVEANVSITVDVGLELALPFLPPPFQDIATKANIFSTGFPIVTSCVSPEDAFKSVTGIVAAPTSASYGSNATVEPRPTATPNDTTTTITTTFYIIAPSSTSYTFNETVATRPTASRCNTKSTVFVTTTQTQTTTVYPSNIHSSASNQSLSTTDSVNEPIWPSHTTTTSTYYRTTTRTTTIYPSSIQSGTSNQSVAATPSVSESIHTSHTSTRSTSLSISSSSSSTVSNTLAIPIPSLPPTVTETSLASTPSAISEASLALNSSVVSETSTIPTPPVTSAPPAPPPGPVVTMLPGFLSPENASPNDASVSAPVEPITGVAAQFTGAAVSKDGWRKSGWQVGALGMSVVLGALLL